MVTGIESARACRGNNKSEKRATESIYSSNEKTVVKEGVGVANDMKPLDIIRSHSPCPVCTSTALLCRLICRIPSGPFVPIFTISSPEMEKDSEPNCSAGQSSRAAALMSGITVQKRRLTVILTLKLFVACFKINPPCPHMQRPSSLCI